jgi:tetratricopeptide (TPR) repeat protein/DNA-binding XRE family transcriptional regulator
MVNGSTPSLARLLRQLREKAAMTQEELAEQASLSARSVSDWERGITPTARWDSIRLLADALGLVGADRDQFEAVARGQAPAAAVAGATRTLPRDVASFTGRDHELMQVTVSASGGGIHAIGGMAGVGKTTFAVHAAHQLAEQFPDGQIFLPLHGHAADPPVAVGDALASLLQTVGVTAQQIPADTDARAALWRDHLADRRLLLVLDDAVDSDQVRPLLPGTGGHLVLVTSRRHLAALDDVRFVSLDTLAPIEAAILLVRLAARPGLDAADPAVREIAQLCGCLPLAVGLMAGQLHHHPTWTAAGLAAELASARDRLKLLAAENRSVAAAFGLSYARLTDEQQRLFRRLGLHPGPDIDMYGAAALDPDEAGLSAARQGLRDLYDRHLLTEPSSGRYRLHDLIREHARGLAAAEPAERDAAIERLLDYYLHVTRRADRYLARRTPAASPRPVTAPRYAPELAARPDAVVWLQAERINIQATAAQATRAGYVAAISASLHSFLRAQGHWDQALALHQLAIEAARHDKDRAAEADARVDLGTIQRMTGDYSAATGHLALAVEAFRDLGSRQGEANALLQLGNVQYPTGDYPAAARSLGRALEYFREVGDRLGEASALSNLGAVQALTGDLPAATAALDRALAANRDLGDLPGQAGALNYLGAVQRLAGNYSAAAASQARALEFYQQTGDEFGQASALNDLGAVQRITGDYTAAMASQTQALKLFRSVGHRLGQASALGDLGVIQTTRGDYLSAIDSLTQAFGLFTAIEHRQGQASALSDLGAVQALTGDHASARGSLNEAFEIYSALGHRQGQAEVLNNMGEALLAGGAISDAEARHREALNIAENIAVPAEEARALEGVGQCQLLTNRPVEAAENLQRALVVYERINSASAARVAALLREQQP